MGFEHHLQMVLLGDETLSAEQILCTGKAVFMVAGRLWPTHKLHKM